MIGHEQGFFGRTPEVEVLTPEGENVTAKVIFASDMPGSWGMAGGMRAFRTGIAGLVRQVFWAEGGRLAEMVKDNLITPLDHPIRLSGQNWVFTGRGPSFNPQQAEMSLKIVHGPWQNCGWVRYGFSPQGRDLRETAGLMTLTRSGRFRRFRILPGTSSIIVQAVTGEYDGSQRQEALKSPPAEPDKMFLPPLTAMKEAMLTKGSEMIVSYYERGVWKPLWGVRLNKVSPFDLISECRPANL